MPQGMKDKTNGFRVKRVAAKNNFPINQEKPVKRS